MNSVNLTFDGHLDSQLPHVRQRSSNEPFPLLVSESIYSSIINLGETPSPNREMGQRDVHLPQSRHERIPVSTTSVDNVLKIMPLSTDFFSG